jgi:periplasmic protein TonB
LPAALATTKEEAYKTVDKMPEASFDIPTYLGENIRYPQLAKDMKIEGRVLVKFVVDKEGNITNPSVVKSPSPLLSEEAIRVIKTMPRWKPGIKDGQNVPVNFFIPISFKL